MKLLQFHLPQSQSQSKNQLLVKSIDENHRCQTETKFHRDLPVCLGILQNRARIYSIPLWPSPRHVPHNIFLLLYFLSGQLKRFLSNIYLATHIVTY